MVASHQYQLHKPQLHRPFSCISSKTDPRKPKGRIVSVILVHGEKMCSGVLDSDDEDIANNRNVSELISTLRTAYRTKDFDRVEEILVSREAKLKRELNKQKYENENLKRRFEELGIRVSKLEEDISILMDMGPQVSKKCGDNSSVKEEKCFSGKGRVENGANTVDVSIQDNGFDCDENTSVAAGAGLNLRSPTKTARPTSASRAIVDILDSDDDHAPGGILRREENTDLIDKVSSRMLKRKQTTCVNVSENINGGDHEGDDYICPTSKRKMKRQQELICDTDGSRANHCSDSTFSGSQNVNKLISSSRQDVIENMNGGIHKVEGNIFPTSTRDMKAEEESILDTDDCPVNCCSATAVSSGCKNVDKLTSSSRQCEDKMKTVHASRNLMHELVLVGDSDSSSSSSDSDDEFISLRIAKLQRKLRV